MLQAIRDNQIHWQCLGVDENEEECGAQLVTSLDEVEYRPSSLGHKKRGAVIVLPPCTCGAQTTLKADYTLSELSKVVQAVKDERSVIWSFVLPLRYVRNIRLHWLLYERGKAEHAPVLPMPAPELLARPEVAEIGDTDVAYALWFGFLVAKQRGLVGHNEMSLLIGGSL